jgi:beta-mannosidase
VRRWSTGELAAGADRYLSVRSAAGTFPANRHFFAAIKDLERERPEVTHELDAVSDHELVVRLRADRYAYFVHVALPDEHVRYSDNYIDLEAGEERTITLTGPPGSLQAADINVRWR